MLVKSASRIIRPLIRPLLSSAEPHYDPSVTHLWYSQQAWDVNYGM